MLAAALFSWIEVMGGREATLHLTDAAVAHGFAAAIPDRLSSYPRVGVPVEGKINYPTVGWARGGLKRSFQREPCWACPRLHLFRDLSGHGSTVG